MTISDYVGFWHLYLNAIDKEVTGFRDNIVPTYDCDFIKSVIEMEPNYTSCYKMRDVNWVQLLTNTPVVLEEKEKGYSKIKREVM